jgi:uncharacterized LabA/DUF88 family protein
MLVRDDCQRTGQGSHVLVDVRYYTGIHDPNIRPKPHALMSRRLAAYAADGVNVWSLPLKYDRDGNAREKGVDVRLALDVVKFARDSLYDVAVIVSEDSDLDEAAQEVYALRSHTRWLAVENALPCVPGSHTHWLPSIKRRRVITPAMFAGIRDDQRY